MSKPSEHKRKKHKAHQIAEAKKRRVREQHNRKIVRFHDMVPCDEQGGQSDLAATNTNTEVQSQPLFQSKLSSGPKQITGNSNMIKLHRLVNRLAQCEVGDTLINAVASSLLGQIDDGYRLGFPMITGHGRLLQCVTVLAVATDPRLKCIRQLQVPADATHVLVFLAFTSEREWEAQAKQMAVLFPEQADKPVSVISTE